MAEDLELSFSSIKELAIQ
ncbi:unnamed protein product, partial [Rotaria sp. Silwood1]